MNKSKKGILVLVILLAVGFAAVTATLVINGTSLFGANNDNFDIIFIKAIVDGEDKSLEVISDDQKSITYTTSELAIKDDESILNFTVKNNSTQYDAEVSIECVGGTNEGTYYKIDKNIAEVISAQTVSDGQVVVTMLKSSTEPIEEEFTCTITANAIERETEAEYVPTCSVVNPTEVCNEDNNVCWIDSDCSGDKTIGDVVTLGTEDNSVEQFYIIESDEENTKMMSMYNLYIGREYDGLTNVWVAYEDATGLQNSSMKGYVSDDLPRKGVTPFSSVDTNYTGSLAEGYVNTYGGYLSDTLGIENTATLISKEELDEILGVTLIAGNLIEQVRNIPTFFYSTSYWTRSISDTETIWGVISEGSFDGFMYFGDGGLGVRPVITISGSLLDWCKVKTFL